MWTGAGTQFENGLAVWQRTRCASMNSASQLDRLPRSGTIAVTRATSRPETEVVEEVESVYPRTLFHTGTMDLTTTGATKSFSKEPLVSEKLIVFIRHGFSTWNEEGRIQGASEESQLTSFGEEQALRCKQALSGLHFDSCFTSPIRRALRTAEIVWRDRKGPLVLMDELREADLGILQGLKNKVAAVEYADLYRAWRDRPEQFCVDGRYPIPEVFDQAQAAWKHILASPGVGHLVITHKSILRAMLCTALGLPPSSFRCVDVNNGGICTFRINKRGEPMMTGLNLTSHLHVDDVYY